MELILMRHGQAEENIEENGEQDEGRSLTKEGAKKIKRVAEGMSFLLEEKEKIHIWSSPLVRAYQTAEILADRLKIKEIEKVELLATGGDLQQLLTDRLPQLNVDFLIIIGHQPYLTDWSISLTNIPLMFKKGAAAGYKLKEEAPFEARLQWFAQAGVWPK